MARATRVRSGASDARLAKQCLAGKQEAWEVLIDRYKRLVFSIPIKYGMSRDDAADVFQAVCLQLFSELGTVRKLESLRSWLITVTVHTVYRWKKQQRVRDVELDSLNPEQAARALLSPQMAGEVEREQVVRDAIAALPPRYEQLIRFMFYEHPPLTYAEIAARLRLAEGSIGAIRRRCLTKLANELEKRGFGE